MGVETRSLLHKTITLQEQLENSQAALLLEQVCVMHFSSRVVHLNTFSQYSHLQILKIEFLVNTH